MAQTLVLAVGTAAGDSTDVTVTAPTTLRLITTSLADTQSGIPAGVYLQVKSKFSVGSGVTRPAFNGEMGKPRASIILSHDNPDVLIVAPGVYVVSRPDIATIDGVANAIGVGVVSET